MNIFLIVIFTLITGIIFVYGENRTAVDGECIAVNKLLGHVLSNNCCLTSGITCKNGHIIDIDLSLKGIEGTIPPEIGKLSQLKNINLFYNDLSGQIPPEIGRLSNLEYINFSSNKLTSIPPEIGNLSNLKSLTLSNNDLSGSISPEIGKLSKLEYLNLSSNELTGPIPPEIGDLPNLKTLDISFNNLCGPVPSFPDSLYISKFSNSDLGKPCPDDVKKSSDNDNKDNSNVNNTSDSSDKDDSDGDNLHKYFGKTTISIAVFTIYVIGYIAHIIYFKKKKQDININYFLRFFIYLFYLFCFDC